MPRKGRVDPITRELQIFVGVARCCYIREDGTRCGNLINLDQHPELRRYYREKGQVFCKPHLRIILRKKRFHRLNHYRRW